MKAGWPPTASSTASTTTPGAAIKDWMGGGGQGRVLYTGKTTERPPSGPLALFLGEPSEMSCLLAELKSFGRRLFQMFEKWTYFEIEIYSPVSLLRNSIFNNLILKNSSPIE